MCEICGGDFKHTLTLEVARVALMAQRIDNFGAFHVVVDDTNVEDYHIRYCMSHPEATAMDKVFGRAMLELSEDDRISALAMSQNRYGCESIYAKPAVQH